VGYLFQLNTLHIYYGSIQGKGRRRTTPTNKPSSIMNRATTTRNQYFLPPTLFYTPLGLIHACRNRSSNYFRLSRKMRSTAVWPESVP
jgi:hypothetical protein